GRIPARAGGPRDRPARPPHRRRAAGRAGGRRRVRDVQARAGGAARARTARAGPGGAMSAATPSVVRAFNMISRVYDNPVVQRLGYRPNHDAVVAALRRHGARRVVDVGCGTGILAARIERELGPDAVYGCDPSQGMLAKARERAPAVHWIQGAAEQLP